MAYINIYTGNPNAGGTDGTLISYGGSQTSPLAVTLDKTKSEATVVKCAVRCDTGYALSGDLKLSLSGATASKWKLSPDDKTFTDTDKVLASTNWSDFISLKGIGNTNTVFWVKVSCSPDEAVARDTSVSIVATGVVESKKE